MEDPWARIISPETDRNEIALCVTSVDGISDDRVVQVFYTTIRAPDDMEAVL